VALDSSLRQRRTVADQNDSDDWWIDLCHLGHGSNPGRYPPEPTRGGKVNSRIIPDGHDPEVDSCLPFSVRDPGQP